MMLPKAASYITTSVPPTACSLRTTAIFSRHPRLGPAITRTSPHFLGQGPTPTPSTFFQRQHQQTMQYHVTTSTARGMMSLREIPELVLSTATKHPFQSLGSIAGILGLLALFQYRGAIQKRLKMVKEESWIFGAGVTMERLPTAEVLEKKRLHSTSKEQDESTGAIGGVFQDLRLLELNPEFARNYQSGLLLSSLLTLGDYMSSLKPKQQRMLPKNQNIPAVVQREIESGLAAALLQALGPNLGRALLPAVGVGPIQSKVKGLAAKIATNWFTSSSSSSDGANQTSRDGTISESQDKGGVPISIMTLLAAADTNAKVNSGDSSTDSGIPAEMKEKVPNYGLSAMEKMTVGEVVKGPSFVDTKLNLVSGHNFVIDQQFDRVVSQMEERLGADPNHCAGTDVSPELQIAKETAMEYNANGDDDDEPNKAEISAPSSLYDPEDRSMAAPVPINPRLFPDLHIGYGGALCSHTKREVLKMRLLALLLNKLGSNYAKQAEGRTDLFSVQMTESDGREITKPADFVQALIDAGHQIEVFPTSRMTTFGIALCVKEPTTDNNSNSWTNIPLGVFVESGYEDKDGNMAPSMMPHSGLDLLISGPLAGSRADGTPSSLRIQHFIGIEGFCGWKSNENAIVPFNEAVEGGPRLSGPDAVRAARLAGLYANVLNGLATEMKLPFGGYGLSAVCNDSAAVLQQCLYDKNTIYPLTSIGRFMQRTLRYAQRLREKLLLQQQKSLDPEIDDLCAIVDAMKQLPSDINAAPSNAASAAKRMLHTLQPKLPFRMHVDSKKVMESILEEEDMEKEEASKRGGKTTVSSSSRWL